MPFPGVPGQIPASLPGMFAGAGMAAIPGYPAVPGMMGGIGPMRSHGGGRYQNGGAYRMSNPYARPGDSRGRQPSFGSAAGMRVPGIEGGMVGGMVGPPQATAGRSLRSYEDLDAAGGEEKVVAELDY